MAVESLRAQLSAAPLKQSQNGARHVNRLESLPRSIERGPVEA